MTTTKKRDKRFKPKARKRVRFGPCLVLPSTLKLIKQFAKDDGSQGLAIDESVRLRASVEAFGVESVKLEAVK